MLHPDPFINYNPIVNTISAGGENHKFLENLTLPVAKAAIERCTACTALLTTLNAHSPNKSPDTNALVDLHQRHAWDRILLLNVINHVDLLQKVCEKADRLWGCLKPSVHKVEMKLSVGKSGKAFTITPFPDWFADSPASHYLRLIREELKNSLAAFHAQLFPHAASEADVAEAEIRVVNAPFAIDLQELMDCVRPLPKIVLREYVPEATEVLNVADSHVREMEVLATTVNYVRKKELARGEVCLPRIQFRLPGGDYDDSDSDSDSDEDYAKVEEGEYDEVSDGDANNPDDEGKDSDSRNLPSIMHSLSMQDHDNADDTGNQHTQSGDEALDTTITATTSAPAQEPASSGGAMETNTSSASDNNQDLDDDYTDVDLESFGAPLERVCSNVRGN